MAKKKEAVSEYNADSVQVDLGLGPVRRSPGVFIGTPDALGLMLIVREVIDNSADEAKMGHGNTITIIYDKDDYWWVIDNGRGIPVDIHKTTKVSALETVLGHLSAGGKNLEKGSSAYKSTIGVHGMGVSITNALSEHLQGWTYRDKQWHTVEYEKGKLTQATKVAKKPTPPFDIPVKNQGTIIKFKIDYSCFMKGSEFNVDTLREYLQLNAYLYPKMSYIFYNKRAKARTYNEPKGLNAYIDALIKEKEVEKIGKPFDFHDENIDVTLQWSSYPDNSLASFVNGVNTAEGGTHMQGLYLAMSDALKKVKNKRDNFRMEDIQYGIIGILNFKVDRPRFSDQTKKKLDTKEAKDIVHKTLFDKLSIFFSKNKSLARSIIKRAVDMRVATETFKLSKQAAADFKVEKAGKIMLPASLKDCESRDLEENELFIVEGKSAEAAAKDSRDMRYQAILPVQGKILNVYRAKLARILNSKPIKEILKSIGYDQTSKNPMEKLRYGKIIILTDPDPDGAHISLLFASLINRFAPDLFIQGRIFEPETSLYVYKHGVNNVYGKTLSHLKDKLKGEFPKAKFDSKNVTRMKGLGEMTPEILGDMAFKSGVRKLIQIEPLRTKKEIKSFIDLISENSLARQQLLGVSEEIDSEE